MKAHLHSVRIAPKKANLIARMVRGMSVPDAVEALRRTNKKGARIVETLLRSAIANASHNDKQDAQTMVIKSIVVNQGTAYRRGMPKARGQQRPFRKFLSHVTVELGFPGEDGKQKKQRKQTMQKKEEGKGTKKTSQKPKNSVKDKSSSEGKKINKSSASFDSSASSAS
ncbi:MAG: 50S ribosomal protein L22 [Candidatus Peribacteraceae bacterium]|nr:50S ribosomal protein L22 [Candidatus Peribacteraceae bacterium]